MNGVALVAQNLGKTMARFDSLYLALEPWFEKDFEDLPGHIQSRIEKDFSSMPWSNLSADQRREVSRQLDYQNDPAAWPDGEYWLDLFDEILELQNSIAQWESTETSSPEALRSKETRIAELKRELMAREARARAAKQFYSAPGNRFKVNSWKDFIPYPIAIKILEKRLHASPDELAVWVWFGGRKGGIDAFTNEDEQFPPSRFLFHPGLSHQYLNSLVGCWFIRQEVEAFEPEERFLTGADLVARWQSKLGNQCTSYISTKINESKLIDLHPVAGGTRASEPDDPELPPLEEGIFPLDMIVELESKELDMQSPEFPQIPPVGSAQWRSENARRAADALHSQPGGSREKQAEIRSIWATGKYTSRDRCAEEECAALDMSFTAARKALRNTPEPKR